MLDGLAGDSCNVRHEMTCANQCNGRGECRRGFCACYAGWYGHDCAQRRPDAPDTPGRLLTGNDFDEDLRLSSAVCKSTVYSSAAGSRALADAAAGQAFPFAAGQACSSLLQISMSGRCCYRAGGRATAHCAACRDAGRGGPAAKDAAAAADLRVRSARRVQQPHDPGAVLKHRPCLPGGGSQQCRLELRATIFDAHVPNSRVHSVNDRHNFHSCSIEMMRRTASGASSTSTTPRTRSKASTWWRPQCTR